MLVVIAGLGKVGKYLLEQFADHDADIIVIEKNARRIEKIKKQYDVLVKPGNMLSHYVLRGTNVGACDFFIACGNSDADNIVSCQLAKRMGARKTVARIYSEDIFPYDINQLETYLGVDWLISPSRLSGYNLAFYLHQNQDIVLDNYFSNQMDIAKLTISKSCSLLGRKISKLTKTKNISVVAVLRNKESIELVKDELFQQNDQVIVLGINQSIIKLLPSFYKEIYKKNEKIYVAGTSASCLFAISLLVNKKNLITLFEKDESICSEIESRYEIKVINLDPSDFNQIKEHQPDTNGVFICASDNDAENLTYALNAEELGFKTIIPMVNENDKLRLFKRFSFSHLIVPPYLSSKEIFRYFSQTMVEDFELIEGVNIRAIIKEIDDNCSWRGKSISDFSPSSDTKLIAIRRNGMVCFPSKEEPDSFQVGDKLLIASLSGDPRGILKFASSN